MASTILAAATGARAFDYPVSGDSDCYHNSPVGATVGQAAGDCPDLREHTLLGAPNESCFRRHLFDVWSSR